MLPCLQPTFFDGREVWEFHGFQSDTRWSLSPSANGDDCNVVTQIEALEGDLLAHHLHPIESAKHCFDAGQPSASLLVFIVSVGDRKLDASRDRLALLHFVQKTVHAYRWWVVWLRWTDSGGLLLWDRLLPTMRRQLIQILGLAGGQSGQHIDQVVVGIQTVQLCRAQ